MTGEAYDEHVPDRERVRAAIAGQQAWGEWGSAREHLRYVKPVAPASRSRCSCGCKMRATHVGCANGLALASGCELSMRRWAS